MRKFIAIIFLSIFAFQMLPLKAIGKMICDGQMTEDTHEMPPVHKKMTNHDPNKLWYLHMNPAPEFGKPGVCFKHALRDETLIKCLHLDVPLQPPNVG